MHSRRLFQIHNERKKIRLRIDKIPEECKFRAQNFLVDDAQLQQMIDREIEPLNKRFEALADEVQEIRDGFWYNFSRSVVLPIIVSVLTVVTIAVTKDYFDWLWYWVQRF